MPAAYVFLFVCAVLPEVEINFDVEGYVHRYAVSHTRSEPPLFERLDCVFVQTEAEASNDALDVYSSIATNDRFKNDRSLEARLSGFLGVLRFNARYHCRRAYATANVEHAAAVTTAFAGTNARTFAFTNAAALTGSNTAADTRSRRGRAGNAVWIAEIQKIDLRKRR